MLAFSCWTVLLLLVCRFCTASVGPQQLESSDILHHLVYFGLQHVDQALGCPVPSHACFYAFGVELAEAPHRESSTCPVVRRNCNRHGECIKSRDWCIIHRSLPAWLLQRFPGTWPTEDRPTYLFGRTDLLNPTHIAALHFLPLTRWLQAQHVAPGQVLMLWDNPPDVGPGPYGLGLARALGETRWLPNITGPTVFRRIRLGEFGDLRFPYPLDRHAPMLAPDASFQHLAALAKRRCGLQLRYSQRPTVVIAKRRHTRVLANAHELQARLLLAGMQASVVDFAGMSFEAQVRVVHEAAVLVSVHGADCMNLMFLPEHGAMVEVLPTHYGYGHRRVLRKGDYFNLAQLLGKRYFEFVSRSDSTIIKDTAGQLVDWNHVNFVGNVSVDLNLIVTYIRSAVLAACGGSCIVGGTSVAFGAYL